MLKTYLYVPEELNKQIIITARAQKKSKAEVIRVALQEGLDQLGRKKSAGAELLLEIGRMAKKLHIKGPRDGSVNHDYYLWGFPKKNPELKP